MSSWYVYSGATGTAAGTSWTNATTTLQAAITLGAAGDTYYVANDHAETAAAATTITFKGVAGNPDKVLCVNRAGSVPPVAADLTTGASITTTGANQLSLGSGNNTNNVYCQGVSFVSASGGTGTTGLVFDLAWAYFKNCTINRAATGANASAITFSAPTVSTGAQSFTLDNTTIQFGNAGDGISLRAQRLVWINTTSAIAGATLPTTLFQWGSSNFIAQLECDGVDLSALGSGKTLIGAAGSAVKARLKNCKLGASVTIAATPTSADGGVVELIGSGSSTIAERNERYLYQGTLTTETTIIRTAGATDGTTPYSWKVVSTANNNRYAPFETFEGAIWNATTGSAKTLTFHCVTDNVTLQDADIWVEVEYLGSSATPVATLVSSAPATQLTAGANLTTDTEAWTTTGLTTPVKQKFSVTFTPQMAGAIRWKVKVAKGSTTVYVDPNPDLA